MISSISILRRHGPLLSICGWLVFFPKTVPADSFVAYVVDGTYTNAGATFVVGDTGQSNSLSIINEGWLQDASGVMGNSTSSTDNSALVRGINSRWENTSQLFIGHSGSRNTLRILEQGRVEAAGVSFVGFDSSSRNNLVLVSGLGSLWQSGGIHIGDAGSANTVIITNRARIISGGFNAVGYNEPSSNNTLRVTGQECVWAGGQMAVGSFGAHHNELLISGGGQVFNEAGYIGNGAFNLATVTDPGSLWSQNATLFVGDEGWSNQLHVLNGARIVSSLSAVISGVQNRALVSGLNSSWDAGGPNGQLVVGGGSGNQLQVAQSGRVNCWLARLMGNSNQVLVTEAGSLWSISQDLKIGDDFDLANGLTITTGARVNARSTIVAGDKSILQLDGAQSVLNNGDSLTLGHAYGAQNQMLISNGAQVNNTTAYIGGTTQPFLVFVNNQNSVLVTGPGSVWNNTNDLLLGLTGTDNSLTIANGGRVNNQSSYLAFFGYSANNSVLVTGANSLWNNNQQVVVGQEGWRNRVIVSAGGQIARGHIFLGSKFSSDNSVRVTDPGSLWQSTGDLNVGSAGHFNRD